VSQSSAAIIVLYNISSLDVAAEMTIVSRSSEGVVQRFSLPQRQNYVLAFVPSAVEPTYVVVHAYPAVSTATYSASSVTITATILFPRNESQSLIIIQLRCSNLRFISISDIYLSFPLYMSLFT